jgi:hypothetical protein
MEGLAYAWRGRAAGLALLAAAVAVNRPGVSGDFLV